MGLFDRFKKDKSTYDSTDIRITDLDKGFVFEYDLETWVVEEVYKYDWGDECFSFEYKISSAKGTRFLSVEEDDEIYISISDKEKVRKIHPDFPELIRNENRPPKEFIYQDKRFVLDEESPGYFCNLTKNKNNWIEFISWDYEEADGNGLISFEQWDENSFEASVGKSVKEFEISNILPGERN